MVIEARIEFGMTLVGDSVAMCSGVLLPPPPPVDPPPPDVPPPEVLAPPPQPESRRRMAKARPSETVRAMFVKCLMLDVGRRCGQGKLRSLQGWDTMLPARVCLSNLAGNRTPAFPVPTVSQRARKDGAPIFRVIQRVGHPPPPRLGNSNAGPPATRGYLISRKSLHLSGMLF